MGSIKPLVQLVRDHEASELAQFEALLSLTNLASTGDETRSRIVAERGISVLGHAMFSDHPMVRTAATEAMSNLVPNPEVMSHLSNPDKLKLWVAFASDFEENFECARAAAGCLAMATGCSTAISSALTEQKNFRNLVRSLLECGNLELMHRVLVVLLNMSDHGDKCREAVVSTGVVKFCQGYVESFHDGTSGEKLGLGEADMALMSTTVNLAMNVVTTFG